MKKLLIVALLATQGATQANLFRALGSMGRGITRTASFAEGVTKTAKATGKFCLFTAKYGTPVVGLFAVKNLGQAAQQKDFTLQTPAGRQKAFNTTLHGMKKDGLQLFAGFKSLFFESGTYCGVKFPSQIK